MKKKKKKQNIGHLKNSGINNGLKFECRTIVLALLTNTSRRTEWQSTCDVIINWCTLRM